MPYNKVRPDPLVVKVADLPEPELPADIKVRRRKEVQVEHISSTPR